MVILGRMQDSWPSAEPEGQQQSSLPRVEDLPVVAQGYDPDRVRDAFDAFYRHLARLDATLRTIEAVEVFRDQAGELRKELRALRTAGWTQQPWLPSYSNREPARPGLPDAVVRWALEACFVIAVPVAATAADLRRLWVVLAAAGAVAIVAAAEWLASLDRAPVPATAASPTPAPAMEEEEPPPAVAPAEPAVGEATEWTLPPRTEAEKEPEADELTAVGTSEPPAEEPVEAQPEEVEEAAADEPRRRRPWSWRRGPEASEAEGDSDEDRPRHVRVLAADGDEAAVTPPLDPWEEGLEPEGEVEPEGTPRDAGAV
jgi:hypothetical protein